MGYPVSSYFRNRLILFLVIMVPIFVFWWFRLQDPMVGIEEETGTLIEIRELRSRDTVLKMGDVRLADGTEIHIALTAPHHPEPGQRIPLKARVYESGKRQYHFDQWKWLNAD